MSTGLDVRRHVGLAPLLLLFAACAAGPSSRAPTALTEPPPGIRLYTGAPEGGLPYRLFVSEEATAGRPHRLLVWLHPSGSDGLGLVEPLVADFARRGFALLTLSRKNFSGWRGAEANEVMRRVVPDAARVAGVPDGTCYFVMELLQGESLK
ncbi:hypothetical protein ACLESO_53490, partial [Pyxidicoccus sp. 3LG]